MTVKELRSVISRAGVELPTRVMTKTELLDIFEKENVKGRLVQQRKKLSMLKKRATLPLSPETPSPKRPSNSPKNPIITPPPVTDTTPSPKSVDPPKITKSPKKRAPTVTQPTVNNSEKQTSKKPSPNVKRRRDRNPAPIQITQQASSKPKRSPAPGPTAAANLRLRVPRSASKPKQKEENTPPVIRTEVIEPTEEFYLPDSPPKKKKTRKKSKSKKNDSNSSNLWMWVVGIGLLLCAFGGIYWWKLRGLPYCPSGSRIEPGVCIPCPDKGHCEGYTFKCACPIGYILSHDKSRCVPDQEIPNLGEKLLVDGLLPMLRNRKGEFECKQTHNILVDENFVKVEMKKSLAKLVSPDKLEQIFPLVYSEMTNLMPYHNIERTMDHYEPFLYTSQPGIRSYSCQIQNAWAVSKWYLIIGTIVTIFAFGLYWRNNLISKLEQEVHRRLKSQSQKHPPGINIAHLRDSLCADLPVPVRRAIWKGVESRIENESRIERVNQRDGVDSHEAWEWVCNDVEE